MTARSSKLGAVLYNTESSFAEDSQTFGTRLQTLGSVDLSGLQHPKINTSPTQQRPHEGSQDIRTIYGGSFKIELLLTGRGATGTSLTQTDLGTLLGHVIGTVRTADVGAAITTQTSSTVFTATGITMGSGTVCRIGVIADGRGNGQFHAVSGESTDVITLLTAANAAPSTSDTCFPCIVVHPSETPGTMETVQTLRFRFFTGNLQMDCHGCFPTTIEFPNLNVGEVPRVVITFGLAWYTQRNNTFPDATAVADKSGAPIAGGSFYMQATGTSTRSVHQLRDFSFKINNEMVPLIGPGGVLAHQGVVGVRRVRCQGMFTTTFDAETSGTTTYRDLYQTAEGSLTNRHILWTGSAADGRAIGIYAPNAKIIDPDPTQVDVGGLNRVTVNWECLTGTTTTSDLTMSNFRLALG